MTWKVTNDPPEKKLAKLRRLWRELPWRRICLASVPVALAVYYCAWFAPTLVPVPAEVNVPFPPVTRALGHVCAWCGEHRWYVVGGAVVLLAGGVVRRYRVDKERYYIWLTVVVAVALGFTYISISAPIDRLIHAVEELLPEDERFPSPEDGTDSRSGPR